MKKYTVEERVAFFRSLVDQGKCEEYILSKLRKLEGQQDWTERVTKEIAELKALLKIKAS